MEDDRLGVVQFQTCVLGSLLSLAFCLGTVALSLPLLFLYIFPPFLPIILGAELAKAARLL